MRIFLNRSSKTLALAGSIATIGDLMQPLAPVSTYVSFASLITLIILILAKYIAKIWNETLAVSCYFAAGLFLLSSLLYFYQNKLSEGNERGVIASEISSIGKYQESLLGKASDIEEAIMELGDNIKDGKKESSTDPRKELNNIGVSWNSDEFYNAIVSLDTRAIKLFLEGGAKDTFATSNFYGPPWHSYFRTKDANEKIEVYKLFKRYPGSLNGTEWGFLQQAIYAGNINLVKFLVDNGEDLNGQYTGRLGASDFLNFKEITPLCMAKLMVEISKRSKLDMFTDDKKEYIYIQKYLKDKKAKEHGTARIGSFIAYFNKDFSCES